MKSRELLRGLCRFGGTCAKKGLLLLIRFYQVCISPRHPGCCRYTPSCSAYAVQAVERFGAVRGGLMAMWRILRCNPFSHGGYDPVPEPAPELEGAKQKGEPTQAPACAAPEKGAQ